MSAQDTKIPNELPITVQNSANPATYAAPGSPRRNHALRITSYNVCYTKLLRDVVAPIAAIAAAYPPGLAHQPPSFVVPDRFDPNPGLPGKARYRKTALIHGIPLTPY